MPCYLFTYHAHGSWMPDNPRGYVRRGAGIQAPNAAMAARYRAKLSESAISFDAVVQRHMVEEALSAAEHQQLRCYFLATESTHLHALVSWKADRDWQTVRAKLRESLTRRLNRDVERRKWFSKSPSRKRVRDRKHFDYLMGLYLPKHSGLKWCEARGLFQ